MGIKKSYRKVMRFDKFAIGLNVLNFSKNEQESVNIFQIRNNSDIDIYIGISETVNNVENFEIEVLAGITRVFVFPQGLTDLYIYTPVLPTTGQVIINGFYASEIRGFDLDETTISQALSLVPTDVKILAGTNFVGFANLKDGVNTLSVNGSGEASVVDVDVYNELVDVNSELDLQTPELVDVNSELDLQTAELIDINTELDDIKTQLQTQVVTIDFNHKKIHDSKMFKTLQYNATLASNAYIYYQLKVPATHKIHIKDINSWIEAIGLVEVFLPDNTLTDGASSVDIVNNNNSNPLASAITIYSDPTNVVKDIEFLYDYYGGSSGGVKSSGVSNINNELIFTNCDLIIRFQNLDGNPKKISTKLEWYEEVI